MVKKISVVDNYDSFVYILVHYLTQLGAEVTVYRNDAVSAETLVSANPDGILLSPGPGTPNEAGITLDVIAAAKPQTPLFGVCLGHQAIAQHFGATIIRATQLLHGKTSQVTHDSQGVFFGAENPTTATRYHSLVVDPKTVPACLHVSATTGQDTIMGLRHKELPIESVQFHPESVLTDDGYAMVSNFLDSC